MIVGVRYDLAKPLERWEISGTGCELFAPVLPLFRHEHLARFADARPYGPVVARWPAFLGDAKKVGR